MAVPKRKTPRAKTRTRRGVELATRGAGTFAVPQLRRGEAAAHRVRQLRLVPRPPGRRGRLTRAPCQMGRSCTVAVDAMGGDRAPGEIVAGALRRPEELDVARAARRAARRDRGPAARRVTPGGRRDRRRERGHRDARRSRRRRCARRRTRRSSAPPRRCATARAHAMVGAGNTGATMASALPAVGSHQGDLASRGSRCRSRSRCASAAAHRRRRDGRLRPGVAAPVRSAWAASTPGRGSASTSRRSVCSRTARKRARATICASVTYPLLERLPGFVGNVEGRDLMADRARRRRHRRLHRQRRAQDHRGRAAPGRGPRLQRARVDARGQGGRGASSPRCCSTRQPSSIPTRPAARCSSASTGCA